MLILGSFAYHLNTTSALLSDFSTFLSTSPTTQETQPHREEGSRMDTALPFPLVQSYYPQFLFKFCVSEIQGPRVLRTVLGLKGQHNCVGKVDGQGSCAVDPVLPGFMAQATCSSGSMPQSPSITAPALRQQLNGGSNYLPERRVSLEQE